MPTPARKINRSAFLYMDPIGDDPQFAQCATCRFWQPNFRLCALFVSKPQVTADATCGLYVYGHPSDAPQRPATVWPREAGLEFRQVRCQNCAHYRPAEQGCHLFYTLNLQLPHLFDLDIKVHPLGCCNANTPKE